MKDRQRHEELEMKVLDQMRRCRILDHLVFGGGTMLRLCFDLPRYSVDLDFYLIKERKSFLPWAKKLSQALKEMGAELTDEQEKHFSFLWEIRMPSYPQRLKIEARKSPEESQESELGIAHSSFSSMQVRLRTLTLKQMWRNKVAALIDRQEIRDAYDLEFLTRRQAGVFESLPPEVLKKILKSLDFFSTQDFKTKLGGILEKEERERVVSSRFSYLRSKAEALL